MPDIHGREAQSAESDEGRLDVPVDDPDPDAAAKADETSGDDSRLAEDDPNRAW